MNVNTKRGNLFYLVSNISFFTISALTLNSVYAQQAENHLADKPAQLEIPPNIITPSTKVQSDTSALPAFPAQQSTITTAQLAQYIRLVFDRHPQLLQSEAKSRAADYRVKEAESGRYPRVVVSGDLGKEQRDTPSVKNEDFNRAQGQLRLVMPMYDPEINAKIEQRNAASMTAGWQLTDVREQLALKTIEAYIALARAKRSLTFVQESLKSHRQEVGKLKELIVKQPEYKLDLPLATARVSRLESLLALHLRQMENARSAWLQLTGLNAPANMTDIPFAHLPDTLDGALDITYQNNAVIRLAQSEVELARSGIDSSVAAYKPKVNLEARSRTGNDWNGIQGNQSRNYVGVTFEWQAFTAFANSYASKAANEDVLAAQYAFDDIRRELRVQVEQEWFNLQSGDVALEADQTYVDSAQKMVTVEQQRFTQRKNTLQAVLDAEKELLSAKLNAQNTQLDMILASWRLLALQGRIQSVLDQ